MASPRARHAAAGAVVAVAAWLAFYATWLLLAPGGNHALLIFSDTAYMVPIVAAVVLCGWAATRVPPALRGFWILIGVGCASWAAGEVLWAISELGSGSVPYPWWTDVFYLGFYGITLVALVFFFRPSFRLAGGEAVLDGALAIAALTLLWWWLVLREVDIEGEPAVARRAQLPGLRSPPALCRRADAPRRCQARHARRLARCRRHRSGRDLRRRLYAARAP